MSFIDRVERKGENLVVKFSKWIDRNPYLFACGKAMEGLLPIIFLGGFSIIVNNAFEYFMKHKIFVEYYLYRRELVLIILRGTVGLIGLYGGVLVAYFLSKKYKLKPIESVLMSVFAIFITSVRYAEGTGIHADMLGSNGLFSSMLIGIIVVEISRGLNKISKNIEERGIIPKFSLEALEKMSFILVVGIGFIILRGLIGNFSKGQVLPEIVLEIMYPIIGALDNIYVVGFIIFLRLLLWYFGVHGGILMLLISPILVMYISENIIAINLGVKANHYVSIGVFSGLVNFTGAGVTIGLVIALILSRNKRYRKIGVKSLKLAFFGINEPLMFGVPIVKNRMMAIPFLIGGTFLGIMPVLLIKWGLINAPLFDLAHMPAFLEGYLIGIDKRIILVQVVQVILSFIIYYPFFRMIDRKK